MTRRSAVLVFAFLVLPAWAQPDADGTAVEADVIAWRRDFHQHPELGNREIRTAGKVAAVLRELGLEVEEEVAVTGVVGVLRGGRPGRTVALRADMDALPVTEGGDLPFRSKVTTTFRGETVGVMHACGHDAHVAILLGVAKVLAARRETLAGTVVFIFQPAEEGPPEGEEGGAALMLKEGVFEKHRPEAIFGLHVFSTLRVGEVGVRSGPMMAESDSFRIVIEGRQTHGSKPWAGIDAISAAADVVGTLNHIVSRRIDVTRAPAVVSVGAIKGGIRYNIVPDRVELIGTVRSFETEMRDAIYAEIRRSAEHAAAAHGAKATVSFEQHTRVLVNDPALTARMRPALERAAGDPSRVREMPFQTVAEDFAYFAEAVPGLYVFIGATPADADPATAPPNHSPDFFVDESGLMTGVRALLALTEDFLMEASPGSRP